MVSALPKDGIPTIRSALPMRRTSASPSSSSADAMGADGWVVRIALQEAAPLLERDIVELLPVDLDEVDGHERATPLGLERVGNLVREPFALERIGPVARGTPVPDEWLGGPHPVDERVVGEDCRLDGLDRLGVLGVARLAGG